MAILTTKPINPGQLCVEAGRIALRIVTRDGVSRISTEAISDSELQAFVDAHVADPSWTDPNPPPPSPEEIEDANTRSALLALRAKARDVYAGADTFTAAQVQRILAGLVLRETRRSRLKEQR